MRQTYILQTVALGTTIHLQQKAKTTGQRAPSIPIEQSVPVFFFWFGLWCSNNLLLSFVQFMLTTFCYVGSVSHSNQTARGKKWNHYKDPEQHKAYRGEKSKTKRCSSCPCSYQVPTLLPSTTHGSCSLCSTDRQCRRRPGGMASILLHLHAMPCV